MPVKANIKKVVDFQTTLAGGYSKEVTPDPIPNSEVKLFSVDGTACRLWESRSPPAFFFVTFVTFIFALLFREEFFCVQGKVKLFSVDGTAIVDCRRALSKNFIL